MTNDQAQGAADAEAPPEFKLPTLPAVPRLPASPRSSEPLPSVPLLTLDDQPGGRSPSPVSFQDMLRAQQEQSNATRRRRRRRSPVATTLVALVVLGAIGGAGYLGYQEYREANSIDDRLPTFAQVDIPYQSFTVRGIVEEIEIDAATSAIPGAPTPQPIVTDFTVTGGLGSNTYDLAGTIQDPNDPVGSGSFSGIADKRGLFVQAPDGTWVLFTQPGREYFEVAAQFGQLLFWDEVVPDAMTPFVDVESERTETTDQGELTTYDIVVDLHAFATEEAREYERWRAYTGFAYELETDDLARAGYPISITVDDDGLVWGYRESNRLGTTEMRLERASTEPYVPTVPATWIEDTRPLF